jgi:hypothetical protein
MRAVGTVRTVRTVGSMRAVGRVGRMSRKAALGTASVIQHGIRLGQETAEPVWLGGLPFLFGLEELDGSPVP